MEAEGEKERREGRGGLEFRNPVALYRVGVIVSSKKSPLICRGKIHVPPSVKIPVKGKHAFSLREKICLILIGGIPNACFAQQVGSNLRLFVTHPPIVEPSHRRRFCLGLTLLTKPPT